MRLHFAPHYTLVPVHMLLWALSAEPIERSAISRRPGPSRVSTSSVSRDAGRPPAPSSAFRAFDGRGIG